MKCKGCKQEMMIETSEDNGDTLERVYRCDACKLNCQVFYMIDEDSLSFGPEWWSDLE